jgi:hypothetical protein
MSSNGRVDLSVQNDKDHNPGLKGRDNAERNFAVIGSHMMSQRGHQPWRTCGPFDCDVW